ncbi:MAG: tRNA pseudouridine(38-40) synthase TruA [Burkholderiales bacterium]|nr:tRNA pseudouridine(38-40) synthase TruA [Burkholderiales bacterium]
MRIALGVEYDGRAFCGWQSQASGCGVQDALERALGSICGHRLRVAGAGRTDSGVHASAQVAHFETTASRPLSAWVRGANTALPRGAAILWAQPVASDFHARFSATGRGYTYVLLNRPTRPGLLAGRVGWFHRPLDLERMRAGAALLLGTHDFSAFRCAECQADSPVRELRRLDIERHGELLLFRFAANAFLQRMVRNIVGSLVYVGKGKQPPSWIGAVLASRERSLAAPTFAPDGLYLSAVEYDSLWKLPSSGSADWGALLAHADAPRA